MTYVFGNVITKDSSLLTLDNTNRWYLVAFDSRKIIVIETGYEIYNRKFLVIIKVFKT